MVEIDGIWFQEVVLHAFEDAEPASLVFQCPESTEVSRLAIERDREIRASHPTHRTENGNVPNFFVISLNTVRLTFSLRLKVLLELRW